MISLCHRGACGCSLCGIVQAAIYSNIVYKIIFFVCQITKNIQDIAVQFPSLSTDDVQPENAESCPSELMK